MLEMMQCAIHNRHTFYFRGFVDLVILLSHSLFLLCLNCKVRDWHASLCVKTTKHEQQQRPCIMVYNTHTTQEALDKKRVPIVAEEMSQVLFSIVTGIKGAMIMDIFNNMTLKTKFCEHEKDCHTRKNLRSFKMS